MSLAPRLVGPRVSLVPVPQAVAVAVAGYRPVGPPLAAVGLTAAPGWPHEDTPDALRPLAEHGGADEPGTWLMLVGDELGGDTVGGDTVGGDTVGGDTVIGDCGWFGPPDAAGAVEIGYGLAAGSRRQGLGAEAVALLVAWVERQPGVRLVTAEVLPGNEASLRLLARLGFGESGSQPPYLRLVRPAG